MRGPVVTPGYLHNPDATAALISSDGWLGTGDIGVVDADGYYSVVDRKKEMIITSSGKNIAPSNIENLLKESPIVGHALAFGDNRPYVVAVLTLDGEVAPVLARAHGIAFTDLADLAARPEMLAMAQAAARPKARFIGTLMAAAISVSLTASSASGSKARSRVTSRCIET